MEFNYYQLKLYVFLRSAESVAGGVLAETIQDIILQLDCLRPNLSALEEWWQQQDGDSLEAYGASLAAIAASSDRANLDYAELQKLVSTPGLPKTLQAERVHPVSGQRRDLQAAIQLTPEAFPGYSEICQYPPEQVESVFWWFWRFYPDMLDRAAPEDGLLFPSHGVLPDCPLHGYQSTVAALAGARFPQPEEGVEASTHPYLLVFTFSPIQEFIKSSRKFADFWAGSYLLHYLSVRLCWLVARRYGPDAVIVPSLWGQDIVDALLLKEDGFAEFRQVFEQIQDGQRPAQRFIRRQSNSLSTAGFPNVITAVVPGLDAAKALGKELTQELTDVWATLGQRVRDDIREKVGSSIQDLLDELEQVDGAAGQTNSWRGTEFGRLLQDLGIDDEQSSEAIAHLDDLRRWRPHPQAADASANAGQTLYPGWSWRSLWDYQLQNSWEPYWTAIPLGVPGEPLSVARGAAIYDQWQQAQSTLAQPGQPIPSQAEENAYSQSFNVGTWWGSLQQRLRVGLQAAKNTRVWAIPSAPGVRSTVSGRFSAVHPSFKYRTVNSRGETRDLREGAGLPQGSMRLFWLLMAKAYPGVFNGSEMLNALEITKRMAWVYGGAAEFLGIPTSQQKRILRRRRGSEAQASGYELQEQEQLFYDRMVKFPNLSSVATGRFMLDHQALVDQYWQTLNDQWSELASTLGMRRSLQNLVRRRPSHLLQVDNAFNPQRQRRNYYNGVMFSSKWLAEDLGLDREGANQLGTVIDQVHGEVFGTSEGSPSDWWAVVLADGDSMGQYISGTRLKPYREYLNQSITAPGTGLAEALDGFTALLDTPKRMGPATHVGLNRSLLDFSNRLVPYLTERRFCGRVVYSGGDDVMVLMPLEDLPQYLMSLRAAWCGDNDPYASDDPLVSFDHQQGYWRPQFNQPDARKLLPDRPLFTMGAGATMSMGVVIAHKTVPLPTVLEHLWEAESEKAKGMPGKNGLCLRVLYSGGNRLEALMNGDLLASWWDCIADFAVYGDQLSPVLYKLAEQLPKRAMVTENSYLFAAAARVIMEARDENLPNFYAIYDWLNCWEDWARGCLRQHFAQSANWEQDYLQLLRMPWQYDPLPLGCHPDDLGQILRFTAFWVDKRVERYQWGQHHD